MSCPCPELLHEPIEAQWLRASRREFLFPGRFPDRPAVPMTVTQRVGRISEASG